MTHFSQYLAGLCLCLALVCSAPPAHAQGVARINVTVPVDFVVGDKQFKAGDYVLESLLDGRALTLRSKDGHVQQTVFTVPIETNKIGKHERLQFHHYGDQEVLTQVWFSGDENGHELIPEPQKTSLGKSLPAGDLTIVGQ
jgi:hypothetical protein